jgi:hypothetical protein
MVHAALGMSEWAVALVDNSDTRYAERKNPAHGPLRISSSINTIIGFDRLRPHGGIVSQQQGKRRVPWPAAIVRPDVFVPTPRWPRDPSDGQADDAGPRPEVDPAVAEVTKRAGESFRDVYLTLVSIIQGVALGYLVQVVGGLHHHVGVDAAGRIVAVFVLIAAVWQEYMIGSTMFAWIPGVIDVITPFLLGLSEGLMIAAIEGSARSFLLLTACTFVIGYIAEVNYSVKAHASSFQLADNARHVISIHPRSGPALALLGVAVAFGLWGCALILPTSAVTFVVWLSAVPAVVFLASAYPRWTWPMRKARDGVDVRPRST